MSHGKILRFLVVLSSFFILLRDDAFEETRSAQTIQKIFFITDRLELPAATSRCKPKGCGYGTGFANVPSPGSTLSYGFATVSCRDDKPKILSLQTTSPRAFFSAYVDAQKRTRTRCETNLNSRAHVRAPRSTRALIFVHGFRASFDDAIKTTAAFARRFSIQGPAVLYSWPSADRYGSFKADNKEALKSSNNFRQVLHDLKDRRFMPLAIIAHSMGSVVVMHALYPDFSVCTGKESRCQVLLVAPSISVPTFSKLWRSNKDKAKNIIVYVANNDIALLSANGDRVNLGLSGQPVGLVVTTPFVLPGMEVIDVSDVNNGNALHAYTACTLIARDLFFELHKADFSNKARTIISRTAALIMTTRSGEKYRKLQGFGVPPQILYPFKELQPYINCNENNVF